MTGDLTGFLPPSDRKTRFPTSAYAARGARSRRHTGPRRLRPTTSRLDRLLSVVDRILDTCLDSSRDTTLDIAFEQLATTLFCLRIVGGTATSEDFWARQAGQASLTALHWGKPNGAFHKDGRQEQIMFRIKL